MVGALGLVMALATAPERCVEEARQVPPEQRAEIMCHLAAQLRARDEHPCEDCPPLPVCPAPAPTPGVLERAKWYLIIGGVAAVAGGIVGFVWGAN